MNDKIECIGCYINGICVTPTKKYMESTGEVVWCPCRLCVVKPSCTRDVECPIFLQYYFDTSLSIADISIKIEAGDSVATIMREIKHEENV